MCSLDTFELSGSTSRFFFFLYIYKNIRCHLENARIDRQRNKSGKGNTAEREHFWDPKTREPFLLAPGQGFVIAIVARIRPADSPTSTYTILVHLPVVLALRPTPMAGLEREKKSNLRDDNDDEAGEGGKGRRARKAGGQLSSSSPKGSGRPAIARSIQTFSRNPPKEIINKQKRHARG